MTATIQHYRPRNPLGFFQGAILITLLLSPALLKIHWDRNTKAVASSEYRTGRSFILSKIDSAVESHDVGTLLRLHGKYAGSVTDTKFEGVLQQALATASAREAQLELAVSKNLDLARHREDLGSRADAVKASSVDDKNVGQKLSQLPR